MSDDQFLARWSRRKQEAKASVAVEKADPGQAQPVSLPPPATTAVEPEIDLSSLPSIDSITSATDITAFLRKGIPPELSRAALRRAWATDPTIRDFVGLAENAWDFNDPTAMPGFGPLDYTEDELAALVDRIVGGVHKAMDQLAVEASIPADSSPQVEAEASTAEQLAEAIEAVEHSSDVAAAQPIGDCEGANDSIRRPTHGGALPR
jgi:hypothetical protein